jgi:cytosine/adenosine deaminase-related metal-dependent hydrolase
MPEAPWTLSARWIFPVDGQPLRQGTVTIHGEKILAVEAAGRRSADIDLGNAAVLPGLVNTHTHLDLTGLRGHCTPAEFIPESGFGWLIRYLFRGEEAAERYRAERRAERRGYGFTGWLRAVIRHRRRRTPAQVEADIRAGLAESIRRGTTLIGDISASGLSWPVLAAAPIRSVVFHELLGLTESRAEAALRDGSAWLASRPATATCRPGLSPHAPYSVRASLFAAVAALRPPPPITIHLAETRAESELLRSHAGPFVPFLEELGVWDPAGLVRDAGAVLGMFTAPAHRLFVHGNYLDPATSLPPGSSLVYCPRTHAAFHHEPYPLAAFLKAGINVALGTDSLASNPDLDLLAEARHVRCQYDRELPGETILAMATQTGAWALGWEDETGTLTPGKSADLVVLDLREEADPMLRSLRSSEFRLARRQADLLHPPSERDPHDLILRSRAPVCRVLCRGRWLVGPEA